MWDLPRSGIEPMSPASAGRFFTTEPPGKPVFFSFFFNSNYLFIYWLHWVYIAARAFSSIQVWTWAWVSSRSWWWTGKPGLRQSTGLQRVTRLSDWTDSLVAVWRASLQWLLLSQSTGSRATGFSSCECMGLVAPWPMGIFQAQGLNPLPLHWQADC